MGGSGNDLRGKDAILANSLLLLKAFSGLKFSEVVSAGNDETGVGMVLLQVVGSQTGSLMGIIPATGKTLNVPMYESVKLDGEGKFVEMWTSIDKFMLLEQIGVFGFLKSMFPSLTLPGGLMAGAMGGAAAAGGAGAVPAAAPAIPPMVAALVASAAASSAPTPKPAMPAALAAAMAAGAAQAAAGRAKAAGGAAPASDGSDWLSKE